MMDVVMVTLSQHGLYGEHFLGLQNSWYLCWIVNVKFSYCISMAGIVNSLEGRSCQGAADLSFFLNKVTM
jgi:hypothetical protein